ncbi:branched-chain amino acid ABC transporter permease [Georgenia halophila]|uniref:Branched-chain amino acid ABC transporter permease n=1 Tax=Georgenia halophila TaxID=620889 RepID=A0ABP8KRZ6_9MICO
MTATAQRSPAPTRQRLDTLLGKRWVRVTGAVLLAVLVLGAPLNLSPYMVYQLTLVAVFAVAVLGLNVVMGYGGQVSLGQSAFLGLGAFVTGYGVTHGWNLVVTFVAACVIPAFMGWLVALAAARLRGLAIAMVTITLPIVGIPLARRFDEITGGSGGLSVSFLAPPEWSGLASDQWRYYIVVAITAVFFLLARNFLRGRMGRALAIVRDNESVALSMGVSPYRYKVLAFTVSALFGGCAGFLYLVAVQYVSPETLSFHTAINILAAMVIGGSASIVGSLLGGVYYVFVPYVASEIVGANRAAMISGAILLAILFVLPGGLVSLPRRARGLSRRRDDGGGGQPSDDGAAPEDTTTTTAHPPAETTERHER